ncbi:MAG: hypothetical protein OIF51_01570 [Cellvibrionaceae bacterium]|nr:hypothetical protein [Cellvibrionaceae bacterium]
MKALDITDELYKLLDYSAIYCSPNCCGLQAFEIHKGLLTRYLMDFGLDLYPKLRREIDSIYKEVKAAKVDLDEQEIGLVCKSRGATAQFQLTHEELEHFFLRWTRVFKQVEGSNAVPSYNL